MHCGSLRIVNVSHSFGSQKVLQSIDLEVSVGEIVCLLGASGSGKSTLLRLVAGLEALQAGEVHIDGVSTAIPGREPPPEVRRCGFVFQDHVLFPHLSAAENVEFGLSHLKSSEKRQRALAQLHEVGLRSMGHRYPHTMSGGEQQRVAIARALAPKPSVMLLDEPFASVDSTLRRRLREESRKALRASGVPSILVTHDAREAMEVADRIAVIHAGSIVQNDTPKEVWRFPVNQFVAELVCDTAAISGIGNESGVLTAFGLFTTQTQVIEVGRSYAVVVRPESVKIESAPSSNVVVTDVRFSLGQQLLTLENQEEQLRVLAPDIAETTIGDRVSVEADSEGVFVYPINDNEYH